MTDFAKAAGMSDRYRDRCSSSVPDSRITVMPVEIGHGTAAMCAMAAEKNGARRALLVVPPCAADAVMEMLGQFHYAAQQVGGRKGDMADACRQAAGYAGDRMALFVATHSSMAEAGHWQEAWPDRKPFDFVAVLDADRYANLRSERGRGIETVARRAGTAVLVCDRDAASPDAVARLVAAWGACVADQPPCRAEAPAGN